MNINLEVTLKSNDTGLVLIVEGNAKVLEILTLLQLSFAQLNETLQLYLSEKMPKISTEEEVREHFRAIDFQSLEAFKKEYANGN
jgi:hypothetical protein